MVGLLRSSASLLCFLLFGLGGLLLSLLFLLPLRREQGLKIVLFTWRGLVLIFRGLGLTAYDCRALEPVRGCVLVANHPSLIDVVLLSVFIPNTFSVAKHGLLSNPFVGRIVRCFFLPDDSRLLDQAAPLLEAGYNILIFPEGTRSPAGGLHSFRRGAAQLALRQGVPIQPVRISQTRRILGKGQPVWEMGRRRITYTLTSLPRLFPESQRGKSRHRAAHELTRKLEELYRGAAASDLSPSAWRPEGLDGV